MYTREDYINPFDDPPKPAGSAGPDCAPAAGSACLVCGSTLTLPITRDKGGIDFPLVHCNHCGSEIPQGTIRAIDRYRATAHDHATVRLEAALREAVQALETVRLYVPNTYQSGHDVHKVIARAINHARDPQNI